MILGEADVPFLLCPDDRAKAKAAAFELFGYRMHEAEVVRYHASDAPLRIVDAPARSSKSYSAAYDALSLAMPTKPLTSSLHWSIGPDYPTNKEFQYWYEALVDRRAQHGFTIARAQNNPQNGNMLIVVEWGHDAKGYMQRAIFEGKSATNARALQGEQVTTATLSEACEQPREIWTKYMASRTWRATFPSTPKPYATWIKELIDQGATDPSLGIEHFHFQPAANPHFRPPSQREPEGSEMYRRFERERRKAIARDKAMGGAGDEHRDPFFAEQFLGLWVFYTGMVLPFRRDLHVLHGLDLDSLVGPEFYVSLDYGYRDASVALFWAVVAPEVYVCFDEIYRRELNTLAFCEEIHKKVAEHGIQYRSIIGDPAKPEVSDLLLRDFNMPIFAGDRSAMRDREAGHRRIVDMLTPQPWHASGRDFPRMFATSNCTHLIHEFETLRYKENVASESSLGALQGADHAFDATRHFVMSRPSPGVVMDRRDWLREYRRRHRRSPGSIADLRAHHAA